MAAVNLDIPKKSYRHWVRKAVNFHLVDGCEFHWTSSICIAASTDKIQDGRFSKIQDGRRQLESISKVIFCLMKFTKALVPMLLTAT